MANTKVVGRKKVSIQKVLHQRAKQIAVRDDLPLQQVIDVLLAYALKQIGQVPRLEWNKR